MHRATLGCFTALAGLTLLSLPALATGSGCPAGFNHPVQVKVTWCCIPRASDFPTYISFSRKVMSAGWGRDNWTGPRPKGFEYRGRYLGWDSDHGGRWDHSDKPLTMHGDVADLSSAAVDPRFIAHKKPLLLPFLPAPYNHRRFIANDYGPGIGYGVVNISAGEGAQACQRALTPVFTTACVDPPPKK